MGAVQNTILDIANIKCPISLIYTTIADNSNIAPILKMTIKAIIGITIIMLVNEIETPLLSDRPIIMLIIIKYVIKLITI